MAKPEIIPLAPEDREVVEAVSRQTEEKMETPSAPALHQKEGAWRGVGEAPLNSGGASREPDSDIRTALVDIERLTLLSYVGVSLLIDRFGVTDAEFAAAVKSTVEFFLRAQNVKPPSAPQPATTPTEKENV